MDLSCSVTPFRIPQRIKMHSEWIDHATLVLTEGEAQVWSPKKPMSIWGES
jgi:hypothetical protein